MDLKTQLDALRAKFLSTAPAADVALVERVLEELARHVRERNIPGVGDTVSDFTLQDARGRPLRLWEKLAQGSVVLTFYRGAWCPYCNLELRAYQQRLPRLSDLGASVIAVSPQTPEASVSMVEENLLDFDVLSDSGSRVARAYGLAFAFPEDLKAMYLRRAIQLPEFNGSDDWTVPIPATFVIAGDGRVVLSHVDADYRNRLDPDHVLAALERLSAGVLGG
jgi:peroxiredoxin